MHLLSLNLSKCPSSSEIFPLLSFLLCLPPFNSLLLFCGILLLGSALSLLFVEYCHVHTYVCPLILYWYIKSVYIVRGWIGWFVLCWQRYLAFEHETLVHVGIMVYGMSKQASLRFNDQARIREAGILPWCNFRRERKRKIPLSVSYKWKFEIPFIHW